MKNLETLKELNYVSGRIYFSIPGFPNVTTYHINGDNTVQLKDLFGRCTAGPRISFDQVVYLDKSNEKLILNRSFDVDE